MNIEDETQKVKHDLLDCFQQAVGAVNGRECVRSWFADQPRPCTESFALLAIGKAALAMTQGAVDVFGGQIDRGLVICKIEYPDETRQAWSNIRVMAGDHPVPDERSLAAGQCLLQFLAALPDNMPLLALISGGTSALVEVLPRGVSLADLQQINTAMLAGGMGIADMNRVRKAISQIKGGRLLNAIGHRAVYNLLLSDVPGDDPAVIGSGLLIKSSGPTGLPENLPESVRGLLADFNLESPVLPDDTRVQTGIVGSNRLAREAAATAARRLGYPVYVYEELLTAEVKGLADWLIDQLRSAEPGIHIWGAEPTVYLPEKPGRGGRNQHLALLLAERLQHVANIQVLVAATDGNDGQTEDAGGLVDGGTIQRGTVEGLNAGQCIARADAGTFLEVSGDLVCTGPTGSNVMDLIIACKT